MNVICGNCSSDKIGWDAWVDHNGILIGGPYDYCQCMECGSDNIIEREKEVEA